MKDFYNSVKTPDGWEDKLYKEIERRECRKTFSVPKLALRLAAGTVAACAVFTLIFSTAPASNMDGVSNGYTLLLSAEEVAEVADAVLGFDNMETTKYDGFDNYTYAWYEYPEGMKEGDVKAIAYAQMPVRVYGDDIESVTFIPKNDNNNVSIVKHISGPNHGEEYIERTGKTSIYGENMEFLTLAYEEQFDRDTMYALKWEYTEPGLFYDEISGQYYHIVSATYAQQAIRSTAVDIEIKMTNGEIQHDTIDVFLVGSTTDIRVPDRAIFKKDIYNRKPKSFFGNIFKK